jgi:signal transduction histidine kinase
MHELIGRIADIGRGDHNAFRPLAHYGTRDFALLSRSFLGLAEQLAQRSNHMSTFAAHLTHELKSPLTSIKGAAELLQDSVQSKPATLSEKEQLTFLSNILGDTDRLEMIMHRLRDLARAETAPQGGNTSLGSVMHDLRGRFPSLTFDAGGDLDVVIPMSAENMLIVLSHLADNAQRHDAGSVRLRVTRTAGSVALSVGNDGGRISEHNQDRIFDAFFTTRREQGGTGMGLAIVQSILRTHGGSIRLLQTEDDVTFEIQFATHRGMR